MVGGTDDDQSALHFLDEVPYPLSRPEARELRNLLAASIHDSGELRDALRALEVPLELVLLDKPARYVWSDVLTLASKRNPRGGARALVEKLVRSAGELGVDSLAGRLERYLSETPPPAAVGTVLAQPAQSSLERILGTRSAFIDIATLPAVVEAARSVVQIMASFPVGPKYGTGFVIAGRRILTNHHVLYHDGAPASSIEARFDYEPDREGRLSAGLVVVADSHTIRGRKSDDVAFFEMPSDWEARTALDFSAEATRPEAKVAIVQHPQGLAKKVAFHTVVDVQEGLVHYLTDTEPGSSGSPVLDARGRVVALHHASRDVKIRGTQVPVNEGIAASRVEAVLVELGAQ